MTRYMLAVHTSASAEPRQPMTEEEIRQGYELVEGLEREMSAANALVFSARLTEPGLATVIRSKGGKVRMTDGPFAEAKRGHRRLLRHRGPDARRCAGLGGEDERCHRHAHRSAPVLGGAVN